MKKNWENKKISEISEVFTDGNWIETKDQSYEGIRLIQTGNVGNGIFKNRAEKSRFIDEKTFRKLKCTEIYPGDCLVSRLPEPVGRACIIPETGQKMITAVDCTIIRFKDLVKADFFNYYTQTLNYLNDVEKKTTGTTRKRISRKNLGEIHVPIPPLPEQKRIVAILDESFVAIEKAKENAEKNLEKARKLFESYLNNIFANPGDDWEEKKLGDLNILEIVDGDRGKNYPKKSDFLKNGFCLFLNTKNVKADGFNFDTTMFINEEKDNALGKGKLKRNDVIMTTRGTIGNLGIYSDMVKYTNIRINSGMLILRPNIEKILPDYLFEVLRSGIIKKQINTHVSGAAQPQLPIKTLNTFSFPLPSSINEQAKIVKKLNDISCESKKLESIYQQKLSNLEELKQSILHKAFNGEL